MAFDIAYMSDSDVVSGVGSSGGVSQEFNQGVAKEARAQTAAGAGSEAGAVHEFLGLQPARQHSRACPNAQDAWEHSP